MNPAHLKATVLTLVLLMLLPAGAQMEDDDKLIVAAHYAPWFKDGGEGWAATVNGVAHYPAFTPTLGWYDSRDDPTLSQHIAWARSYGINTFMIEWPGIATEDFPASIEDVVSLYPGNPDFAEIDFYFVYSMVAALRRTGEDALATVSVDSRAARNKLIADFSYAAENYFPLANYLKIDGKPVVFTWAIPLTEGNLKKAIRKVRRAIRKNYGYNLYLIADEVGWDTIPDEYTPEFDAVMPYIIFRQADDDEENFGLDDMLDEIKPQYRFWRNVCSDLKRTFIPGVYPGYDARASVHAYDDDGEYFAPRVQRSSESFSDFIDEAKQFIDPDVGMFYVTSFNEWNEATNLEPSEEFGFTYLRVLNEGLQEHTPLAEPGNLLRFRFKRTYDPPGDDDRLLAAAFDYIDVLDEAGEILMRIDLGKASDRAYLGLGWYGDEGPWPTLEVLNYAWAGMKKKNAYVHFDMPEGAATLRIRVWHITDQKIRVILDGRRVATITPGYNLQWKRVDITLP